MNTSIKMKLNGLTAVEWIKFVGMAALCVLTAYVFVNLFLLAWWTADSLGFPM